ncbi:hypothetical protein JOE48_003540 [Methylobacterium sp. PvR107]|nr:hypothetical protein [Methylobacterium sp. PvR107]
MYRYQLHNPSEKPLRAACGRRRLAAGMRAARSTCDTERSFSSPHLNMRCAARTEVRRNRLRGLFEVLPSSGDPQQAAQSQGSAPGESRPVGSPACHGVCSSAPRVRFGAGRVHESMFRRIDHRFGAGNGALSISESAFSDSSIAESALAQRPTWRRAASWNGPEAEQPPRRQVAGEAGRPLPTYALEADGPTAEAYALPQAAADRSLPPSSPACSSRPSTQPGA